MEYTALKQTARSKNTPEMLRLKKKKQEQYMLLRPYVEEQMMDQWSVQRIVEGGKARGASKESASLTEEERLWRQAQLNVAENIDLGIKQSVTLYNQKYAEVRLVLNDMTSFIKYSNGELVLGALLNYKYRLKKLRKRYQEALEKSKVTPKLSSEELTLLEQVVTLQQRIGRHERNSHLPRTRVSQTAGVLDALERHEVQDARRQVSLLRRQARKRVNVDEQELFRDPVLVKLPRDLDPLAKAVHTRDAKAKQRFLELMALTDTSKRLSKSERKKWVDQINTHLQSSERKLLHHIGRTNRVVKRVEELNRQFSQVAPEALPSGMTKELAVASAQGALNSTKMLYRNFVERVKKVDAANKAELKGAKKVQREAGKAKKGMNRNLRRVDDKAILTAKLSLPEWHSLSIKHKSFRGYYDELESLSLSSQDKSQLQRLNDDTKSYLQTIDDHLRHYITERNSTFSSNWPLSLKEVRVKSQELVNSMQERLQELQSLYMKVVSERTQERFRNAVEQLNTQAFTLRNIEHRLQPKRARDFILEINTIQDEVRRLQSKGNRLNRLKKITEYRKNLQKLEAKLKEFESKNTDFEQMIELIHAPPVA